MGTFDPVRGDFKADRDGGSGGTAHGSEPATCPAPSSAKTGRFDIPDLSHLEPEVADWPGLLSARASGICTAAGTPLRREGEAIGVFVVYRDKLQPFTAEELSLQQSFADQAVIAIENARLFNETRASTGKADRRRPTS